MRARSREARHLCSSSSLRKGNHMTACLQLNLSWADFDIPQLSLPRLLAQTWLEMMDLGKPGGMRGFGGGRTTG